VFWVLVRSVGFRLVESLRATRRSRLGLLATGREDLVFRDYLGGLQARVFGFDQFELASCVLGPAARTPWLFFSARLVVGY
jgi:hypothetical protein